MLMLVRELNARVEQAIQKIESEIGSDEKTFVIDGWGKAVNGICDYKTYFARFVGEAVLHDLDFESLRDPDASYPRVAEAPMMVASPAVESAPRDSAPTTDKKPRRKKT